MSCIPSTIFITLKSRAFLQPAAATCVRQIEILHDDFTQVRMSDSEATVWIRSLGPGWLSFWNSLQRGVQRSDFLRILYIYVNGGFYFDTDIWFAEPVTPLLGHSLVFPFEERLNHAEYVQRFGEQPESEEDLDLIGNYAFGAEPRHPFLGMVLQEIVESAGSWPIQSYGDNFILDSTGPNCLNRVWRRYRRSTHFQRNNDSICIVRGENDDPFRFSNARDDRFFRFGKYANHLMLGTWRRR